MNTQAILNKDKTHAPARDNRSRLLDGIPAAERRIDPAGISTALLEGGEGPPVVLLHGPGESSVWWMRVIQRLVKTHRVIVPELPGHGATGLPEETLDEDIVLRWLGELIERTCSSPPALVGHILGGAIAARFAIEHVEKLARLVLVDSLGLEKFRPAPAFAFRLIRFMIRPTRKNYDRFLPHCMYDVEELSNKMGKQWEPFLAYNLECSKNPDTKTAMRKLMQTVGTPKIPSEKLARIEVPTALIWGRHDRANKLEIAEEASERYGWPLHVIEKTRDDPKLERPEAFVQTLLSIMDVQPAG